MTDTYEVERQARVRAAAQREAFRIASDLLERQGHNEWEQAEQGEARGTGTGRWAAELARVRAEAYFQAAEAVRRGYKEVAQ